MLDSNVYQVHLIKIDIDSIESVLFVLKRAEWAKGKGHAKSDFWDARGVVRDFLDNYYELSAHKTVDGEFPYHHSTMLYKIAFDALKNVSLIGYLVRNNKQVDADRQTEN